MYGFIVLRNLKQNSLYILFVTMVYLYMIPYCLLQLDMAQLTEIMQKGTLISEPFCFSYFLLAVFYPAAVNMFLFSHLYKGELQRAIGYTYYHMLRQKEVFFYTVISSFFIMILPQLIVLFVTVLTEAVSFDMFLPFFLKGLGNSLEFFSVSLFVTVTVRGMIPQMFFVVICFLFPLLFKQGVFDIPFIHHFTVVRVLENNYNVSAINILLQLIQSLSLFWVSAYYFIDHKAAGGTGCVRYSTLETVYLILFLLFTGIIAILASHGSIVLCLLGLLLACLLTQIVLFGSMQFNKGTMIRYVLFICFMFFAYHFFI